MPLRRSNLPPSGSAANLGAAAANPEVAGRVGPSLRFVDPIGYLELLSLAAGAQVVLTDSGGLQKEAYFVGTRCVTLRDETEWVESVSEGANECESADLQLGG